MTLRYGDVDLTRLRVGDIQPHKEVEDPETYYTASDEGFLNTKADFNYQPIEQEYTVTDFENDPNTIRNFELVTNYFEENKNKLLDLGAWGGDDDVSEFMRDRFFRIST